MRRIGAAVAFVVSVLAAGSCTATPPGDGAGGAGPTSAAPTTATPSSAGSPYDSTVPLVEPAGAVDPGWQELGPPTPVSYFSDTVGEEYLVRRQQELDVENSSLHVEVVRRADGDVIARHAADPGSNVNGAVFVGGHAVLVVQHVEDPTRPIRLIRVDLRTGARAELTPASGRSLSRFPQVVVWNDRLVVGADAPEGPNRCLLDLDVETGADDELHCVSGDAAILFVSSTPDALSWLEVRGEDKTIGGCRTPMMMDTNGGVREIAPGEYPCAKFGGIHVDGWDVYDVVPPERAGNFSFAVAFARKGDVSWRLGLVSTNNLTFCGDHLYFANFDHLRRWKLGEPTAAEVLRATPEARPQVATSTIYLARCAQDVLTTGVDEVPETGPERFRVLVLDTP